MRAATIGALLIAAVAVATARADQTPDRRVVDAAKSGNAAAVVSLLQQKADTISERARFAGAGAGDDE